MTDPLTELRQVVVAAIGSLQDGVSSSASPALERPPKPEFGDYSTNAAMLLAPALGSSPRDVAERLRVALAGELGDAADRIDVAGPGFLNVFLSDRWHRQAVASILAAGEEHGHGTRAAPEKILVEFVSANPTGPLTVASGRGAAYGDSLARLLEIRGDAVEREYLLNDVGGQIERFAASIAARMRGEEPPEDGYAGEYIADLATTLREQGADPDDLDDLARRGTEAMRGPIAATLERFGVRYDNWFSERTLHEGGRIEAAIEDLRERGHVYDAEGAVWLRTTAFGDDKDRVLVRAGGEPTYFGADIAYHRDKLERGFERLINPLGPDHHGYVPRMRAAIASLGADPECFEGLIMQLVNVVDGGERARMSKRRGEFVTLDELIDDIGVDATRFFMLQRSHDTAIDLDLELARKASQDNPVYYVQYAHARIASILRKAASEGGVATDGDGEAEEEALIGGAAADPALSAAAEPSERALIRRLLELPEVIGGAGERRAPHRLCAYATATAADFHAFYRDCQVVGSGEGTEGARLGVCVATKRTITTTLGLLGVSAPERM